ncbi:MAG: PKD domain-containing protein, partial [Sphingobacteriales bacterium]
MPVNNLTGYSYIQLNVSKGVHNLSADDGFTAIAYGFGNAESYGYSAGVNVKTLGVEATSSTTNNLVPAGCLAGTYKFDVWVPYEPIKLVWDFDNGSPAVEDLNPVAIQNKDVKGVKYFLYRYKGISVPFSQPKDYAITVTATKLSADACGSEDVIETSFTVYANPDVKFKSNKVCEGEETSFSNESDLKDAEIKKWEWDFGDGSPNSFEQNPRHIFNSPGVHLVKLRLETLYGCDAASIIDTVIVYGKPKSDFETLGSCIGRSVTFIDKSIVIDSAIVKWIWIYGDGKIDTLTNNASISHNFQTLGTFQTKLKVVSSTGCESVTPIPVTIHPIPVPDFDLPESCVTDVVQFLNKS